MFFLKYFLQHNFILKNEDDEHIWETQREKDTVLKMTYNLIKGIFQEEKFPSLITEICFIFIFRYNKKFQI